MTISTRPAEIRPASRGAADDAGYDLTRLAWLLADLPVDVTGRLRSDRVMYFPAPPLPARPASTGGRRPRHGHKLAFGEPATWPGPAVTTVTDTARYGTAQATAWQHLHQRLEHRGSWEDHDGELPVVEGTLIRLQVGHLPGCRDADPVWLWSARAAATEEGVNRSWQAFLRRFDIERTFRFLGQTLGWTRPNCGTRPPPTAGPGSSSPPTPSCTSPATSPPMSGCPGSGPAHPAALPPPASAVGFAVSARTCPFPPARRNPPGPDPAARMARRTAGLSCATTSARSSSVKNRRRRPAGRQVK